MTIKLRTLPKAAKKTWEEVSTRDDWGVECVYEHGARYIWDAAIRYEKNRQKAALRKARSQEPQT